MFHDQSLWEYRESDREARLALGRLALQRRRRIGRTQPKQIPTRQGTTQTSVRTFSMGSTSRKIYRAEICLNRGQPSNNGGDSVGECLHPGLVNCQLDISKNISILRGFLRPIMRCGESESS